MELEFQKLWTRPFALLNIDKPRKIIVRDTQYEGTGESQVLGLVKVPIFQAPVIGIGRSNEPWLYQRS